jgi:hypothetical protein
MGGALRPLRGALDGREVRVAGVDAAPGEGLEPALRQARSEGYDLALLFASPTPALRSLGFRPLPATEAACRARMPAPWPKEPSWVEAGDPLAVVPGLRPCVAPDGEALAAIHDASAGGRFRLLRGRSDWERILERLFSADGAGRRGEEPIWVIDTGRGAEAYVIVEGCSGNLRWREHGARPEAGRLLVDLFWAALARARRAGAERIEGWYLPPAVTETRLYPFSRRPRRDRLPLVLALHAGLVLPDLGREEDCRLPELDAA